MAELSLREQLQPGLLDRLTDDERFVTQIQVAARRTELERLRIKTSELGDILAGMGLKAIPAPVPGTSDDEHDFWFVAAGRSVGLQQIKEFVIKPPGAPAGVALSTFCRVQGRALLNTQTESLDKRVFTMRRLRDAVFRDITWLLNSMSLDSTEDLSRYPEVRAFGAELRHADARGAADELHRSATYRGAHRPRDRRLRAAAQQGARES